MIVALDMAHSDEQGSLVLSSVSFSDRGHLLKSAAKSGMKRVLQALKQRPGESGPHCKIFCAVLLVVMQKREHVVWRQPLAPVEEIQFHHETEAADIRAQFAGQRGRRNRRAARSQ